MTSHRRHLLRTRDGHHARVGFAELFFDLVFVFAVTQLSHSLLAHLSPLGVLETAMLFLAVWWSWIFTAWVTNWLDPETAGVRLLLFALMAVGLVLAMAIPEAFGKRGLAFALAYAASQAGRAAVVAWIMRGIDSANSRNFVRIALWGVAGGAFWVAGALADPHARLLWWAAALVVEYLGPASGFRVPGMGRSTTRDWSVEGGHLAERCGLFLIIALGESILITGATFAGGAWDAPRSAGFAAAFVGAVAMWWIYFNVGAERATRRFTADADPGRIARLAYTYLHIPIVAGVVLAAAGDELVLAHPAGHADPMATLCILGGPALFLLGTTLFKRATAGWPPLSHIVGLGLFAALAAGSTALAPVLLAALGSAVLVLVAIWETRSLGRTGD